MDAKKIAAEKAVSFIEDGMTIGLGTGTTAYWAIQKIAERVQEGLNIKAVASSVQSEDMAKNLGISIIPFSSIDTIDLTIDGADEVDLKKNLIKGGGGALLREKIIAYNSQQFYVIVDESKKVNVLGHFPLPVEIAPFAFELTLQQLKKMDCEVTLRIKDGNIFETDNGNFIADCQFNKIPDPDGLNTLLNSLPGVLETGLFVHTMVHSVIVGYTSGQVEVINNY